jgi:hypothetical protein
VAHFIESGAQARRKGDRAFLGAVGNGRGGAFYRVNTGSGGGSTQVVVRHFKSFGYSRGRVKQMNDVF